MKASKKSLHAKLYEFTYISDLPNNLCPYFWKVIFGIVVFIPNLIVQIPSYFVMLFYKKYEDMDCLARRVGGIAIYFVLAAIGAYLFITINFIKAIFGCYSYDMGAANAGLIVNAFILITCMVLWIIFNRQKDKPEKSMEEEKRPNLLVEFIKAKYNRYCPKIDWE